MKQVMDIYGDAVKDVAMILLIIAGSGALKQVLSDSGVSTEIGTILQGWQVHPLVLAWLICCHHTHMHRICDDCGFDDGGDRGAYVTVDAC